MTLNTVITFQDTIQRHSLWKVISKLDFIIINKFCLWKAMSRECEDKSQTERKYLQKAYLVNEYYLKYKRVLKTQQENNLILKWAKYLKRWLTYTQNQVEKLVYEKWFQNYLSFSSDQISGSVVSRSLWPHESQHARPPCPSPTPGVHSNSRPSSQWCLPAILSSTTPFSSCPNPFQHQRLFQWVNCSHEVAKVLEFQLQHQYFQWTPRTDLL